MRWVFAAIALAACGERAIDHVAWACVSDAQCGAGLTCRAGVCVAAEGPLADGRVCVTRTGKARKDVRFALIEANRLEVIVDGRSIMVTLPDGVVGLADSPSGTIDTCCESPCCVAP